MYIILSISCTRRLQKISLSHNIYLQQAVMFMHLLINSKYSRCYKAGSLIINTHLNQR